MKLSVIRTLALPFIGVVMLSAAMLAQRAPEAAAAKIPAAHLTNIPKAIGFGSIKHITLKSINIKNNGTAGASVNVVSPPPPFAVTSGGGSFTLAPKQAQRVSVQFAPAAAGSFKATMAIQCADCSTAAQNDIEVKLSGSAKSPVATPSATPTPAGPTPSPTSAPTPTPAATPSPASANALPFSVNSGSYGESVDMPYVSVTVCAVGTSNCATIRNVLVDTGSFGLRIFGSQLSGLGLAPNTNGNNEVGECAFFGSGSTWGSVSTVDVNIAGEPTITIPIQVIDDLEAFAPAPRSCTSGSQLLSSPTLTQFDGLLGIGQYSNDIGFTDYYNCSGESCSSLPSPPGADIVVNPVSSLPVDNNGVVVSLRSISAGGEPSAAGTFYFGIGTESDNQPGSVNVLTLNSNSDSDSFLDVNTRFNGTTAGGFFDTGSNGYFFNDDSMPECSDAPGFYCPSSNLLESATIESVNSPASNVVNFEIDNADSLFDSDGFAFDDLGGTYDGGDKYDGFDWGLPFFFGRTVYMGMAGSSSPLGTGPYIAY